MQRTKRNYAEKIFNILAESPKPLNPLDIQKNWRKKLRTLNTSKYAEEQNLPTPSYSRIYEAITKLKIEGFVDLKSVGKSKKNNKTTYYGLTFKGVLKYLSEYNGKLDEAHLLNVLERQGKNLDYAPFQEIRWLFERNPAIIRLLISQANLYLTLNPSLNSTGQFADKLSKHISDPDLHLSIDNLRELRGAENSFLKDAFGKIFLLNMVGSIKKDSENEKLRQFAERILKENKAEITLLEQATSLFKTPDSFS